MSDHAVVKNRSLGLIGSFGLLTHRRNRFGLWEPYGDIEGEGFQAHLIEEAVLRNADRCIREGKHLEMRDEHNPDYVCGDVPIHMFLSPETIDTIYRSGNAGWFRFERPANEEEYNRTEEIYRNNGGSSVGMRTIRNS